jgi:xylan 1,4-beta-xylosidase
MTMLIQNPILRGFHPDPSICRVGDDYYIATSTFEWYPGVQLSHSRDLVHWRTVGQALNRAEQLDMRGNPDSGGVWAPSLSHADGLFWLVYSDVKRIDGNYKDAHNYIVTAASIDGPWSDPVYVNSSGFDPSLFHDADGRKWFVNMIWDHEASMGRTNTRGANFFGGILLQEFDPKARELTGPVTNIFKGTSLGLTEAPHLFRRGDYYYLIVAEGGTGYEHAISHARAGTITGPYEIHPDLHLINVFDRPEAPLQRTGHGQIVETPDGPYHTFLCTRPLPGTRRSPMGRETGIAKCKWRDNGWLYLDGGGTVPGAETESPKLAPQSFDPVPDRHDFNAPELPNVFMWLRTPEPSRLFSLSERPGHLRLFGRESVGSWFEHALVARRQTEWVCSAETKVEFDPQTFQQMAGLIAFYNRTQFHYLNITRDQTTGDRVLRIQSCADWPEARLTYPMSEGVKLPSAGTVWLGLDIDRADLQFRFSTNGTDWFPVGPVLDATILSDEGVRGEHSNFTGTFIGMAAHDVTGRAKHADFAWFSMTNIPADQG